MSAPQVTGCSSVLKKPTVGFRMTKARPAFVRAAQEMYGTVEKEPRGSCC